MSSNSFHFYDVNAIKCYRHIKHIFETKDHLKAEYTTPEKQKESLDIIISMTKAFCEQNNLDYEEEMDQSNQIIIPPSNHGIYKFFTAIELTGCELYRINSFLNHQLKNYTGETSEFLGIIEFFVCSSIQMNSPRLNENERLTTVMKWVEDKRASINTNQPTQDSKETENNTKNIKITIHNDIIEGLHDILSFYFDPKVHDSLSSVLDGESISKKLQFKSNGNKLVYVFYQLKESQHILESKNKLNAWICKNFSYQNNKNIIVPFKTDYVKRILSGQSDVSKNSRINIDDLNL